MQYKSSSLVPRPSPALVLQATDAGARMPGYEARFGAEQCPTNMVGTS